MSITMAISTDDRSLAFRLLDAHTSLESGARAALPSGGTIQYQGALVRKSFDFTPVLQFVIDTTKDIDVGLFSAWLYDKVKNSRVQSITINSRTVDEITEDGIRRTFEEQIRIEQ
ncbi:MAG: hypothetical protein ABI881_15395 [Betaproteobacteria bacterium]